MTATVVHADGVRCPRCLRWTVEGTLNFEHLCDRCCRVILDDYPDHWSASGIREAYVEQRKKWCTSG